MTIMKSVFTVFVLFGSIKAMALPEVNRMDMGLMAGYRLNDATSNMTGYSVDGRGSLQVGGIALIPMSDKFTLRTGAIYSTRNFQVTNDVTLAKSNARFAYFEVPVTFTYNFSDLGGIFIGPGLGIKVGDNCSGVDCSGVKSTVIPIQVGGHFKVAPQFSAEFYLETAPGKLSDQIKDPTAVVLDGMFTFE